MDKWKIKKLINFNMVFSMDQFWGTSYSWSTLTIIHLG